MKFRCMMLLMFDSQIREHGKVFRDWIGWEEHKIWNGRCVRCGARETQPST